MIKNIQDKFYQEFAILELFNKHFWKSRIGVFSSLLIPIVFMIIYKIISLEKDYKFFSDGLASYLSFSIFPLIIIAMPQLVVELKTSIILRKISTSDITALKFSTILLLFYLAMTILSNLIIILIYAIMLWDNIQDVFGNINWWHFLYSLIMIYMCSLSFGLFMCVFLKKSISVPIFGFSIMMIAIIFAGQFLPIGVLAQSKPIMIMSLFSPLSYPLALMNTVTQASDMEYFLSVPGSSPALVNTYINTLSCNDIFDLSKPFYYPNYWYDERGLRFSNGNHYKVYEEWHKLLNLIMPYVFSIIFFTFSIFTFNWTSR